MASLAEISQVADSNEGIGDWFTLAGYVALENQLTKNSGDTQQATYETDNASDRLTLQGQPSASAGAMNNKALLVGGAVVLGVVLVAFMLKK